MKVRLVMGTVIIATSMLLSGCGEDKPEDVAEEFATSLSEVNIENVKSLSSVGVQEKIKTLKKICKNREIMKLGEEALSVANEIGEKTKEDKYSSDIQNFINTRTSELEAYKKETKAELLKKYGKKKPSQEIQEKEMKKFASSITAIYAKFVEKEMKLFDIKNESDKEIKDVLAMYLLTAGDAAKMNRGRSFSINPGNIHASWIRKSAEKVLLDNPEQITKLCVNDLTDFGNIDDINFIEVKNSSADEVTVRLELIRENGESEKVYVEVEKIKDKWKVSSLSLDMW